MNPGLSLSNVAIAEISCEIWLDEVFRPYLEATVYFPPAGCEAIEDGSSDISYACATPKYQIHSHAIMEKYGLPYPQRAFQRSHAPTARG